MVLVGAVGALVFLPASNCASVPAVTADVGQVTVCVENAIIAQVQAGATSFEAIAVAIGAGCGLITAQEVENIIQLWTNGTPADAGTAMHPALATAMADPTFMAKLKAIKHVPAK